MGFHGKQIQPGTLPLDRLYTTGYIPSAASDLTTVEYVQALNQGLFPKAEARVRATGNINLLAPPAIVDTITMVLGDRMVLGDQADPTENGIYDYNALGLVRSSDADDPGDLKQGTFIYIQEGATWGGFGFFISGTPTVPPNIDIGVDPIIFSTLQRQSAFTIENGLTALGNNIRLGGPLVTDTDIDGTGAYRMTLSNLIDFEITTPAIKFLFDKGGSAMRVENGASTEVFMDLTDDWRFNLAMNDGGGAGEVNAAYSVNLAANGIVDDTNSVNAAANSTLALGAKYSFAAGRNHLVGDGVGTHGDSSAAFGIDTINNGEASMTGGVGAQILYVANQRGGIAHGFSTGSGLKPVGVPYVTASSGAVNISRNTVAQTAGFGALAQDSIILGGYDHHIPADSPGSVILGGNTIVARAADPNQVYLPSLNITTALLNDDALSQILVRDPLTGLIKYRTAGSLAGATDVENGLSIDEGFVIWSGPLVQNTLIDLAEFGIEWSSSDINAYIDYTLDNGVGSSSNFSQSYNQFGFQVVDSSNAFTFAVTPIGATISVVGANPALQYAADYSAYYTNRTLVDKEYVDDAVAGGSFSLTNGNGTTANGSAVDLGGTLTADVDIEGNFQFVMGANSESLSFISLIAGDGTAFSNLAELSMSQNFNRLYYFNGGNFRGGLNINVNGAELRGGFNGGNGDTALRMGDDSGPNTTYFRDDRTGVNQSGLQYFADYSANYTNRSLVDKEYVDNAITAGGVTASNGLTKVVNDIQLGGALSANTTITSTGFRYLLTIEDGSNDLGSEFDMNPGSGSIWRSYDTTGAKGSKITIDETGFIQIESKYTALLSATLDFDTLGSLNYYGTQKQFTHEPLTVGSINYNGSVNFQRADADLLQLSGNSVDTAADNLTNTLSAFWNLNNGFQMFRQRYSDTQPDPLYAMFQMNIDDAYLGIYDQNVDGSGAFIGVSNSAFLADYTPYSSVNNNNAGVSTSFRLKRTMTGTGATNPNAIGTGARLDYELLIGSPQQVISGAIDNIATAVGAGWETKFVIHVGDTGVLTPVLEIDKFGAKHGADYSANYTNRSLVDKEYVDNAILTAGGNFWPLTGSATLTGVVTITGDSAAYGVTLADLSNFQVITEVGGIMLLSNDGGMQLINPGGTGGFQIFHDATANFNINVGSNATTFYMGHAGTGNMVIQNTGGDDMRIQNNGSAGDFIIENTQGAFSITNNAGTAFTIQNNGDSLAIVNNGSSGLGISSTGGDFELINNGDNFFIEHNGIGQMLITDGRVTPAGIEYAADYSANYTNRSLVDKEYVDGAVSGVTASNGITNVGGDIQLGGALTSNTSITGAFDLSFGTAGSPLKTLSQRSALTATANSQELIGTVLNTTYTDGAFTGVVHTALVINNGGTRLFQVNGDGFVGTRGRVAIASANAGLTGSAALHVIPYDATNDGTVILADGGALVQPNSSTIRANTPTSASQAINNVLGGSYTVGGAFSTYVQGTDQWGFNAQFLSPNSHGLFISNQSANVTNYNGYMALIQYACGNANQNMTASTDKGLLTLRKVSSTLNGFDHTGAFVDMYNGFGATGDFIKAANGVGNLFRVRHNGNLDFVPESAINITPSFGGLTTTYGNDSMNYSAVALMKYDNILGGYASGSAIDINRRYTNTGAQPTLHTIKIASGMDNDVAIIAGAQNYPMYITASSVDVPTHAGHFEATLTKNNPTSTPIAVYAKATITGIGTAYSFYGDDGVMYNDGNLIITQSIIAGTSSAPAGSLTYTFGDGNINRGVFGSAMFGELSEIDVNVGSAFNAGENNYISAYGGHSMGRGVKVSGVYSWAGGWYSPTSEPGKTNPKAVLVSGNGSFGYFETNGSQTDGHGVLADSSAVLGGVNPNIPVDSPRSVILGGNAIKARAAAPDQVYVPNFNIVVPPANDNALTQILVRDNTTGEIKYRDASSLGSGISFGASGQIPYTNATADGFSYDADFSYITATNRFLAGQNFTITGSGLMDHHTILGVDHTIAGGTANIRWATLLGEVNTISSAGTGGVANSSILGGNSNTITTTNNAIFNAMILGGAFNVIDGTTNAINSALAFGRFNDVQNAYGVVIGFRGIATGYGSVVFAATTDENNISIPKVRAAGLHAMNFSTNTLAQTAGHGALADYSGIFAGIDHNIPSDSPGSAIIGGSAIKARAADPDQVYVPNFNIVVPPANDDALTQILARDGVTGEIKYRTAASLGGGGSIPAPQEDDRDMVPAVTTGDEQPTGLTITNTPTGLIIVALNGEIKSLGNGVKTKHCYFSGDGGVTARAYSAIVATDELYWNGVIAGYDLDTSDTLDFYYI